MNRERRAVLKGAGALLAGVAGSASAVGSSAAGSNDGNRGARTQRVDTSLPPGVTLFDLNDDGEYTARVEAAPAEMRDEAHSGPIHVTSHGNSTVDFAASIAAPDAETTLGDLTELTYDYYEGPDNVTDDGASAIAPDQTFVVVENADGRHGMYLIADAGGGTEQWATFDVLARLRGGSNQWFEYTAVEEGYDGQTFGDAIARFGEDARLVRVGVGHGDAVTPTTLDLFYDNLVVNGTTERFPTSVAKRVSSAPAAMIPPRPTDAPPF